MEVKIDRLPELPLEKIFGHLNLEDRIRLRGVSRSWRKLIDSFRPTTLCFSSCPKGFIYSKSQLGSEELAQNLISSSQFKKFFKTFGQSMLSALHHLRLFEVDLNKKNRTAQILNSFDQLEELDIIRSDYYLEDYSNTDFDLKLNLPMLSSIQLKGLSGIKKLTLDAPKLKNVKLWRCAGSMRVEIVHGESIERLIICQMNQIEVEKLKNLKYLYCGSYSKIKSTLLLNLKQLKEIHLDERCDVTVLFQQKERYDHANLKIYFAGFLLNDAQDPAINSISGLSPFGNFNYLAGNASRLANDIPLLYCCRYVEIEHVAQALEFELLKRFTDLEEIWVDKSVQDIERFLDLLKSFDNIVGLDLRYGDLPQELFDRLPDHCIVQRLNISHQPANLNFLFELKSLIYLILHFPVDLDFIRKVLTEVKILFWFQFKFINLWISIKIDSSKKFEIKIYGFRKTVSDSNAAINYIKNVGRIGRFADRLKSVFDVAS